MAMDIFTFQGHYDLDCLSTSLALGSGPPMMWMKISLKFLGMFSAPTYVIRTF